MNAAHGLGTENLRTPLLKSEGTGRVDKLRNLKRGIVQAGTDGGARHIQQNGCRARRKCVTSYCICSAYGKAGEKIEGRATAGGVDFEIDPGQRELEILRVKAIQRHLVGVTLGCGVLNTRS